MSHRYTRIQGFSRPLAAITLGLAVALGAGCAASNTRAPSQETHWTPPANDKTYRSAEEASRAYDTAKMMAEGRTFRYAGGGRWEVLQNGEIVRTLVIGGQVDIDWKRN